MDERLISTKLWADSLAKELTRESLVMKIWREQRETEARKLTRWDRMQSWLWSKQYRLREYFRNLWRALLGKAEWE